MSKTSKKAPMAPPSPPEKRYMIVDVECENLLGKTFDRNFSMCSTIKGDDAFADDIRDLITKFNPGEKVRRMRWVNLDTGERGGKSYTPATTTYIQPQQWTYTTGTR